MAYNAMAWHSATEAHLAAAVRHEEAANQHRDAAYNHIDGKHELARDYAQAAIGESERAHDQSGQAFKCSNT